MYRRITAKGAPPRLPAKQDGDQSAPPYRFLQMPGYCFCLIMRMDTPLRRFTGDDTKTFGGQFTRR
ncbi:hypothetical protein PTE30175_01038 [Pandoraea terrae]|uniref:Uncharacterized protein n=1 Tax=Pandoraea terrae TaxID=1537710 RepID=A0A5E4T0Q4_9BURK|nr:hypothetical protein PTE30175_01038 [Pandoraea terrae]